MIVVVADDLTGAAEIGGIGLRYGLKVDIVTRLNGYDAVDLLIIATNTRSMSEDEAATITFKLFEEIHRFFNLNIQFIYKKVDSVLRGHIMSEISAMLRASGRGKALLVPENPSMDRIISDGQYYINNTLLHETNFSNDPDFKFLTSNIVDILGNNPELTVSVSKLNQPIPKHSVILGEAVSETDVDEWAAKVDEGIIPVGSADFFSALLKKKGYVIKKRREEDRVTNAGKRLFICGSSISGLRKSLADFKGRFEISNMPDELFYNEKIDKRILNSWVNEVAKIIDNRDVFIVINKPIIANKKFAKKLRSILAQFVNEFLVKKNINELIIEGGSTAFTIFDQLSIKKLVPVYEFTPGIIRCKIPGNSDTFLTLKPGSYKWNHII